MNALLATLICLTGPSGPENAVRYANEKGGLACLVMVNGKIVAEEYANGGSATRATELASGTKSFTGVMAMCGVQDGLLTLDERVADTIPEWRDDPRKSKITIRQLLTLTSGLKGGTVGRPPSYAEALKVDTFADPGKQFQYGPAPFQVFGEVMRRKLKPKNESVMDYLTRRILKPIDLKPGVWRKDADGNINLPSGALLTAREWSKFGEMVRKGGEGVVPKNLLDQCFVGTKVRPGYGLSWWLPSEGSVGASTRTSRNLASGIPDDVWMAAGAGGQKLIVIRSLNLVAVRLAPIRGERQSGFDESTWLTMLCAR